MFLRRLDPLSQSQEQCPSPSRQVLGQVGVRRREKRLQTLIPGKFLLQQIGRAHERPRWHRERRSAQGLGIQTLGHAKVVDVAYRDLPSRIIRPAIFPSRIALVVCVPTPCSASSDESVAPRAFALATDTLTSTVVSRMTHCKWFGVTTHKR